MKLVLKRTVYSSYPYIRVCRFGGIHQEDNIDKATTFDCVESANAFLTQHREQLGRFTYLDYSDGKIIPVSQEPISYEV
jgi:hypothetical protein